MLIALVGACPAGCPRFCSSAREEMEGLGARDGLDAVMGGLGFGGMLLFCCSATGCEIGGPGLLVLGLGGGSAAVLLCVAVEGGKAEELSGCWGVVVSAAAPSLGGGVALIDFFFMRGFGTGDGSLSTCG